MNQIVGHLVGIEPGESGRLGIIDVRGARIRVPLLLTPDAVPGDALLVDAGIAVAVLEPIAEAHHHQRKL